jgi:hypothetical protein
MTKATEVLTQRIQEATAGTGADSIQASTAIAVDADGTFLCVQQNLPIFFAEISGVINTL